MKIVFFSNFLNHHQLPFCLAMQKLTKNNFYFIATEKIPKERIQLGYEDMDQKYSFVIQEYKNNKEEIPKLINESDIMIIGNAPKKYAKQRIKTNKLLFRYSERIYKKKFNMRTWGSLIKNYSISERQNVYLLCSSAFAPYDFNRSGAFLNKCYKWGYFPEHIEIENLKNFLQEKNKKKILWVGRFLNWKHPETAINIAKKLSNENIDFELEMIGDGPLLPQIQELAKKYGLDKKIHFSGPQQYRAVRKKMQKANIFIFTSDRQEGWGAVLNEAMDSACIVMANSRIGSVPYLIQNKKNGYIYQTTNELFVLVKYALLSPQANIPKQIAAYKTIKEEWNADIAARRLITLSKTLQSKQVTPFKTGPCSKAKIIRG